MSDRQNHLHCAVGVLRATTKTPEVRHAIDGLLADKALTSRRILEAAARLIGLLDAEGAARPELGEDWVSLAELGQTAGGG